MRSRLRLALVGIAAAALTLSALTATTTASAADEAPAQSAPAVTAAAAADGVSFIDQFDTGINTSFWYVADGFNNGSHQNCQFNKNNASVANGQLTLKLDDTPYGDRQYSCADLQSYKRYGYGTYETRMKAGKASGTNSAFFTYIGPYYNEPWDEIDFEVLGKDPTKVEVNSWVNGDSKGPGIVNIGADSSQEWVDFAFVWEPSKLRFFINGTLVHTFTGSDVPTHSQLIIPMIWGSDTLTGWMGPFVYPGQPITAEYDYIAYTELGDPCPFVGSVACGVEAPKMSFLDNFDTLDTSRWFVSSGWAGSAQSNCMWDRNQVAVANGILNLSYAKKTIGDRQYACAEVQSRSQRGYGVYEARLKGVAGSGLMSSFFTWVGASGTLPSEAIDLAKLLGVRTNKVKFNTWQNNQSLGAVSITTPGPTNAAFIDYGVKWSASRMDFYINGTLVHSITDAAKIPDRTTNMFLNIWGSNSIPDMGAFVDPGKTVTFQVDRVAYTAPGEPCQFTGSIAC